MDENTQDKATETTLEALRRRFQDSDDAAIIPPDYIVNGTCTYEVFERYLLTHSIQQIRAVDAIKIFAIVLPLSQAQGIQPEWNIQDIIGKERKDEDGKE
jgi:hypothetical protein